MQKQITTIVFDLGGVLVDWNPYYLYNKIAPNEPEKVKWFLDHVCTTEWNIEQDAGRTIEEAVQLKVQEFPEYKEWIEMFYERWTEMFDGVIEGTLELFEKIKASGKYKYYALTNWSAEKWPTALELFPFLKTFEGVVVSGQENTRKPFNDIYEILFERYQINPEEAIFIDDNLDNVNKGKELGLNAFQFTNPEQFKKDLESLGVIL